MFLLIKISVVCQSVLSGFACGLDFEEAETHEGANLIDDVVHEEQVACHRHSEEADVRHNGSGAVQKGRVVAVDYCEED